MFSNILFYLRNLYLLYSRMFQLLQPCLKHLRLAVYMIACGVGFSPMHISGCTSMFLATEHPSAAVQVHVSKLSSCSMSHSFIHIATLLPPNHCGFIVSLISDCVRSPTLIFFKNFLIFFQVLNISIYVLETAHQFLQNSLLGF